MTPEQKHAVQMPEALSDEQVSVIYAAWRDGESFAQLIQSVADVRDAMWAKRLSAANAETTRIVAMLDAANEELKHLRAGQGDPVLYIHPATYEMAAAHVGAWKPGHELPGYIPLFTQSAVVPKGTATQFVEWMKAQPDNRVPTTIDGALAEFQARADAIEWANDAMLAAKNASA